MRQEEITLAGARRQAQKDCGGPSMQKEKRKKSNNKLKEHRPIFYKKSFDKVQKHLSLESVSHFSQAKDAKGSFL